MLEKEQIQYRGFRNLYDENGEACGFEFCLRSTYYRGVWLSQLRVGRVIVDGEEFLADSGNVTWIIRGQEYTPAEMAKDNIHFWPMNEVATIRVKKPGGLAQGYHDVAVRWGWSSSYISPAREVFDDTQESPTMMRDNNTSKRRMLMV
ncbi:MAG: D-mannonate dehydratase [Oscillospiraceae bacterium]|nr:D-mannonate dehydratase [Oscillospiraceae bacterium]